MLVKNRKKDKGFQNHLYKKCGCQFIRKHKKTCRGSLSGIDLIAKIMLVQGIGTRDISAILGIRPKKVLNVLASTKYRLKPKRKHDKRLKIAEFLRYEGNKKNKVWLIYIYHREKKEIVSFVWGKRELKAADRLRKCLKLLGITDNRIVSDNSERSITDFSRDRQLIGKTYTAGIEGNNHRLRRVRRKKLFNIAFFYTDYVFPAGSSYFVQHSRKIMYTENAVAILTVKNYNGIGRAWIVKNLKGGEKTADIVSLLNKAVKADYPITVDEFEEKKGMITEKLKRLEGRMDGVVAVGDDNFPQYRGNVKNSEQPVFLCYRGDITLLRAGYTNIAVIGTVQPDEGIKTIEQAVVSELVKKGVAIISGLALGCDTIAHEQALESNGKTIAVLPSPLDNILPPSNKELADTIVRKKGLLITEYVDNPRSKQELSGRYQERDRLQALFSDGIILSASCAKNSSGNDSGSRLAMNYALDYSIPRAVIYDGSETNQHNQKYDLNRQVIQEQKDIIIITRENMPETLDKLIAERPDSKYRAIHQMRLFN
jgi:DNA processing protein